MMVKCMYVFLAVFAFSCAGREQPPADAKKQPNNPAATQSANPYAEVDLSPMDMSYFPVDYSKKKMAGAIKSPPIMRLIYSRPQRNGRVIFGGLLKYGERWRLGANEASEIEFFQNVTVQGKKVNAGRYIIYCIPYEDHWTIILNSDLYTWGLKIDSTKDLMQFDIPVKKASVNFEYFTMVFQPAASGDELVMAWDDTEARLPISF